MGLDGISINQLRTQQASPSEVSRNIKTQSENNQKIVDGLSQGQRVDPNKDKEHNNSENFNFEQNENENSDNSETADEPEVIKYDLSQNNKYELKIDNSSNTILIVEKATQKTVDKIEAKELSTFVHYLSHTQGSIVNRKF